MTTISNETLRNAWGNGLDYIEVGEHWYAVFEDGIYLMENDSIDFDLSGRVLRVYTSSLPHGYFHLSK